MLKTQMKKIFCLPFFKNYLNLLIPFLIATLFFVSPVVDKSFLGNKFLGNLFIGLLWINFFIFTGRKNIKSLFCLSFLIFLLFIKTENINFKNYEYITNFYSSIFIFSCFLMLNLFFQWFNTIKESKGIVFLKFSLNITFTLIYGLIILILAIPLIYYLNFQIPFKKEELFAIFQTNIDESLEFTSMWLDTNIFVIFPVLLIIIFYSFKSLSKIKVNLKNKKFNFYYFLILFIILNFFLVEKFYQKSHYYNFIKNSFNEYSIEIDLYKKELKKREVDTSFFNNTFMDNNDSQPTYVVLIGESTNKRNMSLYGYPRKTTPNLDKLKNDDEIVVLDRFYSNHTHTVPVLKYALNQANQYNKLSVEKSPHIIEIANKINYETYWLTNQNLLGAWDNQISMIAKSSDVLEGYNNSIGKTTNTQNYDEVLVNPFKKIINKKPNNPRLIFIHFMGTHSSYESRFTSNFKYFKDSEPDEFQGILGRNKIKDIIKHLNNYDNAILYHDSILNQIIQSARESSNVDGIFYFSDHADDVIGNLGHISSKYSYYMSEVPAFFWFSEDFKLKNMDKYEALLANKSHLISNDLVYDSLISMLNINTNLYEPKFSIFNRDMQLLHDEAKVLHGKKYVTESNFLYWQKQNSIELKKNKLSSKFFPHRVNSVGKLKEIWMDGYRAFEVDIRFGDNQTNKFQVGHNPGDMGLELEEYLKQVNSAEIEKIWFDMKNLTIENYQKVHSELERLNSVFHFKEKVIFETSMTNRKALKLFKDNGWHTSYYLPTKIATIDKNDIDELKKHATEINKILSSGSFSAISYDHRLYDFVKRYIKKDIPMHIWFGPQLWLSNFSEKIKEAGLYQDNRVLTFLCSYKSQFNL